LNLRHKSGLNEAGDSFKAENCAYKMTAEKMHNEKAGEYYLMNLEAIGQHPGGPTAHTNYNIQQEPPFSSHGWVQLDSHTA
jgi:hypothetical protein